MKFANSRYFVLIFLSGIVSCLCSCEFIFNDSDIEKRSRIDSLILEANVESYKNGKEIFKKHCNTCHVAPERQVTDQLVFDGIFERLPKPAESYFTEYVLYNQALLDIKDEYAVNVHKMTSNPFVHNYRDSISLMDIQNIIAYIKVGAKLKYRKQ